MDIYFAAGLRFGLQNATGGLPPPTVFQIVLLMSASSMALMHHGIS